MKRRDAPSGSDKVVAQEALLPFLLNPATYPHRPRQVRLVQTHSSFVFLAPPLVFKVKKPVNFGFLNFSTLERRRHFCEREVELNRRLSPGIYLGVVPISRTGARFGFGAGDRIVEYAVKMRLMSNAHFLHRLVARDAVTPGDINRIVLLLKAFYLAQHPTPEVEAWGRVPRLRISTDENFRQSTVFVGTALTRPAFDTIRHYTNRFYARNSRLFASRIREKWIRDCHGDLRLEHIHVTPRALHIYDCIEFNDRLRYVDVANDAAFLAMDLEHRGRRDLSRLFERHLAAALNDGGMPALMDFYKCYRAYVRGKVEGLQSVAHAAPEADRQASLERARRYFRLALGYAVHGSEPMVLAVMGRIASGKSTLAAALGAELGWEVVSSDRMRKEMAGFPLYERSSAAARRRLYSVDMTRRTYDRLLVAAEDLVHVGRSVILDATFAQRAHRSALLRTFASHHGTIVRFLETTAPDRVVQQRLREREARADEVSDARLDDFNRLTSLYEPPDELKGCRCVRVHTSSNLEKTVTAALKGLASARMTDGRPLEGIAPSMP